MIQEFLTNNLIRITEDENVEKLLKASTTLEKKLSKNKSKIPTLTLIALDPEIKVTDPNIQEVQQLILDNWKTFTSNCKDTPLTYIRAVILETLEKLSSDINVANIVFLSSRNITKQLNLKGKEKELIIQFITELGNKVETFAAENWSISKDTNLEVLKTEIAKITDVSFVDIDSENQNAVQNSINKTLTQVLSENQNNNYSLQMRTELLWWKESCYSNTLKYCYRDAQNGLLQVILALDYSSFVPSIFPQSADYFLKETHSGIISGEDKKIKLSEIFKFIDSSKEILRQYLIEETFEDERISLTDFVKGFVFGQYSLKNLKNNVGISENIELTLSEFTLWLFHDLQVLNSIKNK